MTTTQRAADHRRPLGDAPAYSADRADGIVRLRDMGSDVHVAVAPHAGNMAFEMKVCGHEILRFPFDSIEEFLQHDGGLQGIPLLAPWANRLDEQAFYANGERFAFDMGLGNVRGAIPIHGFLSRAYEWQVGEIGADHSAAWVTSTLDVFANPRWMKQFPFAHRIGMTHRLESGTLEVATWIENMAAMPMPVSIGFHPYFTLTDSPRDEWTIAVGARSVWPLDSTKIPTGVKAPIATLFEDPARVLLKNVDLDHVFGDLVRDHDGRSTMTVTGRNQRIDVIAGPRYPCTVIYAPQSPAAQDRNFICFEPMAAITNGINLAHRGLYDELQSIPPGGTWRESFWVRPGGFS
ncbi:MAG: aldose 1-epimerase [Vicinamibacterales bacterium]